MRLILTFLAFFQSSIALSFPEMIRHGYSSCTSCHVSPSGGGVLNAYGRSLSSEVLSTYRDEKLAGYYLPSLPSWLNVGGDVRYLNLTSESYKSIYHHHFLMQAEGEIALSPIPGLTFVGTYGVYNVNFPEKQTRRILPEQRRSYVLLDISKNVSIRAGRFYPNYGIHFEDHTISSRTRMGFDTGQESLTSEIFLTSNFGQLSLASVVGNEGSIYSSQDGYSYKKTEGESGLSGRATYNVGRISQVSASAQRLINKEAKYIRTSYGIDATLSLIPQIYTMFEIDQQLVTGQKRDTIWVNRTGVELYRGITLLVTYEGIRSQFSAWRWGLTLYPLPHLELSSEYQRKVSDLGLKTESWVFLVHYYL